MEGAMALTPVRFLGPKTGLQLSPACRIPLDNQGLSRLPKHGVLSQGLQTKIKHIDEMHGCKVPRYVAKMIQSRSFQIGDFICKLIRRWGKVLIF